jgi:hypothetical protein
MVKDAIAFLMTKIPKRRHSSPAGQPRRRAPSWQQADKDLQDSVHGGSHSSGSVSVEPFHLFRYLDEQSFRFNGRKGTDAQRFAQVLQQIVGKRLEYKNLTGKAAC